MPYTAEISRSNPTALLIMIDQSYSMSESFGGGHDTKAVEAARIVNRLLTEFTIKCAKGEDDIRDYFDVGVMGFGNQVGSAFGGALGSELLIPISKIAENPLRLDNIARKVSDGAGGLVEENVDFPIWIDPIANGHTPMCQALGLVRDELKRWVADHSDSFPPTVVIVTDGEVTDGDPEPGADELRTIATSDGNSLLFSCHISSSSSGSVMFPVSPEGLTDRIAKQLYNMSSPLPSKHLELAQSAGVPVSVGSRGFAFNADYVDLTLFLEIGTRVNVSNSEFLD